MKFRKLLSLFCLIRLFNSNVSFFTSSKSCFLTNVSSNFKRKCISHFPKELLHFFFIASKIAILLKKFHVLLHFKNFQIDAFHIVFNWSISAFLMEFLKSLDIAFRIRSKWPSFDPNPRWTLFWRLLFSYSNQNSLKVLLSMQISPISFSS
jgi:hypothetical protein